jgi:hypothetical protein
MLNFAKSGIEKSRCNCVFRGETTKTAPNHPEAGPAIVEHEATNSGRKYVHDTIAHIQHQEQGYCIAGQSVPAVLRMVLGYLLTNGVVGGRIQFFVDGQQSLQAAIFKAFSWFGNIGMLRYCALEG